MSCIKSPEVEFCIYDLAIYLDYMPLFLFYDVESVTDYTWHDFSCVYSCVPFKVFPVLNCKIIAAIRWIIAAISSF